MQVRLLEIGESDLHPKLERCRNLNRVLFYAQAAARADTSDGSGGLLRGLGRQGILSWSGFRIHKLLATPISICPVHLSSLGFSVLSERLYCALAGKGGRRDPFSHVKLAETTRSLGTHTHTQQETGKQASYNTNRHTHTHPCIACPPMYTCLHVRSHDKKKTG